MKLISYPVHNCVLDRLPKKSDVERYIYIYLCHVTLLHYHYYRKIELVEYAKSTRLLFIRLLALVKWASAASGLSKCDVSLLL